MLLIFKELLRKQGYEDTPVKFQRLLAPCVSGVQDGHPLLNCLLSVQDNLDCLLRRSLGGGSICSYLSAQRVQTAAEGAQIFTGTSCSALMSSTDNTIETSQSFSTTGKRLAHILDKVGFKRGRGRMQELHTLIKARRPDLFLDVSFNTIRSWFRDHAPHVQKIEAIVHILHEQYRFEHDLDLISAWWKLGGFYPFVNKPDGKPPTVPAHGQDQAKSNAESPVDKFVSEDPVFISQIILLIDEMREQLDIALTTSQSAVISGRIIAFCTKNQLDIESEHLKEQISRMLHLAEDGLI